MSIENSANMCENVCFKNRYNYQVHTKAAQLIASDIAGMLYIN